MLASARPATGQPSKLQIAKAAAGVAERSALHVQAVSPPHRPRRRWPQVARWLHTYVSLLGFAALLFFALTGITLNHPELFEGATSDREWEASVPSDALFLAEGAGEGEDGSAVDPLGFVEWLRRTQGVRGYVEDFEQPEDGGGGGECIVSVSFQGPAYACDAVWSLETGTVEILESTRGAVAIANDLHKARHSGTVWSGVVDCCAVVLAVSGLTGVWLLLYLKKVRLRGLGIALGGAAALAAFSFLALG